MNYRLLIQYDGTRYDGWQRQGNTEKTIQGKIEEVLKRMTGQETELFGSGRTDAGVHALGQVANFHWQEERSPEEILRYLNEYLPEDIGIRKVEKAGDRFHSRLNAKGKCYRYRIQTGSVKNVFERRQIYPFGEALDLKAMERAGELLKGKRDFRGYSSLKRSKKSTVRELQEIRFREKDGEIWIDYYGDGFLYNMVRILTGTLIEVGSHQRTAESVRDALISGDRQDAGFTAPARGLTLVEVYF